MILWFNLYKMLVFDRNYLYTHFCFSELLILREKRFVDFFFKENILPWISELLLLGWIWIVNSHLQYIRLFMINSYFHLILFLLIIIWTQRAQRNKKGYKEEEKFVKKVSVLQFLQPSLMVMWGRILRN